MNLYTLFVVGIEFWLTKPLDFFSEKQHLQHSLTQRLPTNSERYVLGLAQ